MEFWNAFFKNRIQDSNVTLLYLVSTCILTRNIQTSHWQRFSLTTKKLRFFKDLRNFKCGIDTAFTTIFSQMNDYPDSGKLKP